MENNNLELAVKTLSNEFSCVVVNNNTILHSFYGNGLKPLWQFCREYSCDLYGAAVADKIIGKAAAALFIVHDAAEVYGALMSRPALEWLTQHGVVCRYGKLCDFISNRDGTGLCPMELLIKDCNTPGQAVEILKKRLETGC